MKLAPLLAALSVGSLLVACNSLDNPFHAILNTGNDARVYNSNTGSYEWPDAIGHPIQPLPKVAAATSPDPTPSKKLAARYYDPKKGAFVKGTPPPKPKASPAALAVRVTPVPAPAKGTGVYNLDSGKFDWSPSGIPTAGKPAAPSGQTTLATPAPSSVTPGSPAAPLFPQ
jgi:hypothetical protein